MDQKVALVTGANRGLGLETARQLAAKKYRVIVTSRDEAKGKAAVQSLTQQGASGVEFHQLDVEDKQSIGRLVKDIGEKFGRVDVLVNNAGQMLDSRDDSTSTFDSQLDKIRKTMEANVYGAFQLIQAFGPLMKKNRFGRIVNVSSGMGQLTEMNGGYPGYRISKTALNAVTRIFADELSDSNVLVNSVCPGWVKTDMGGPGAERSVEQGADTIVWLATLPDGGPTGGFFRDREPIAW